MWFYVKRSAKTTYKVCDDAGEKLAWFLGITKPKYYGEIQEFQRMDEEEREAWRQEFQDVQQTNEIVNAIVSKHILDHLDIDIHIFIYILAINQ